MLLILLDSTIQKIKRAAQKLKSGYLISYIDIISVKSLEYEEIKKREVIKHRDCVIEMSLATQEIYVIGLYQTQGFIQFILLLFLYPSHAINPV
jgi:hypothetical protein